MANGRTVERSSLQASPLGYRDHHTMTMAPAWDRAACATALSLVIDPSCLSLGALLERRPWALALSEPKGMQEWTQMLQKRVWKEK